MKNISDLTDVEKREFLEQWERACEDRKSRRADSEFWGRADVMSLARELGVEGSREEMLKGLTASEVGSMRRAYEGGGRKWSLTSAVFYVFAVLFFVVALILFIVAREAILEGYDYEKDFGWRLVLVGIALVVVSVLFWGVGTIIRYLRRVARK